MAVAAGCSVRGAAVSSLCSSDAENSGVGLGWVGGPSSVTLVTRFSFLPKVTELHWVWVWWPVGIFGVPGEYMEGNLLHVFSLS